MRHAERTEAARLTGFALRGLTGVVKDAHGSIATRVFGQVRRRMGPLGHAVTPVELAHDGISAGVYAITGRALEGGSLAVGLAMDRYRPVADDSPSIIDRPALGDLLAVVHGFHGDKMHARESAMSFPMTLRRSGSQVLPTRAGLAEAYPDARSTIIVFVHGLVGTEQKWKRRAIQDEIGRRVSYGRELEAKDVGSALWVRYNTGLRVSHNGRELRDLLRRVHARWPVPVERIVLVGHSMGGLVAHSALAQADLDEPWTEVTTDTVTLGTPHHGAPLERAANTAAARLVGYEPTRWVGDVIRYRSDGIRDLRHGNLVTADWHGHDPEGPEDTRTHARPHESVRHLAVVATIARDPRSPFGQLVGDSLVTPGSAQGWDEPSEGAVGSSETVLLGGLHHLDLLGHPRVYAVIEERLTRQR